MICVFSISGENQKQKSLNQTSPMTFTVTEDTDYIHMQLQGDKVLVTLIPDDTSKSVEVIFTYISSRYFSVLFSNTFKLSHGKYERKHTLHSNSICMLFVAHL
jgi:hypothetical protein